MGKYTAIDDPSAHFQVETYTGAGANTSVTFSGNSDLKPDFLWLKNRSAGYAHAAFDSNRNLGSAVNAPFLEPNDTSTENSNQNWWNATNYGINTDGFQFGSVSEHNLNNLNSEYVAWAWKANGGTTSTNTDGTITTTTQANGTAGFSIATWTGNGTNGATIGHGNGGIPNGYIVKRLDATSDWGVGGGYTGNVWVGGTSAVIHLNTTGAVSEAYNNYWGSSFPNSQILPLSQNAEINASGGSYVGYFFRSIQGYSKLGRYTGNGNSNGSFVYTGFKPAFLMIKDTGAAGNWFITDHKRNPFNLTDDWLVANGSGAETNVLNASSVDYLSNGFKLRTSYSETNTSGRTYIYMAFAENPFVTSTGIMGTAR